MIIDYRIFYNQCRAPLLTLKNVLTFTRLYVYPFCGSRRPSGGTVRREEQCVVEKTAKVPTRIKFIVRNYTKNNLLILHFTAVQ